MAKTIIISNRLPVSIQKKDDKLTYSTSAGGLATGLGSIYKQGDNLWIGWPGFYFNEQKELGEITAALQKENMAPVFLSKSHIEKFYEGFSNATLWPLFHYFTNHIVFEEEFWVAYKEVNTIFCEEILKYAHDGDIIWIHDYQLLLLPQMLREALPHACIGFFQHIPFPSYEIFRILPWRAEILNGMVGADLIGFHTYDDVRHFLSAVSRIIGQDNKMGQLIINERLCNVDSFPMGIDYDKFYEAAGSKETKKEVESYRKATDDKKIIISIDRLDYSKGIPERLMAFEGFIEKYPEFQGKVSLIMVVVPSRDNVELYQKLKIEIDELVGRINGKYSKLSWNPIQYFYRSFPFQTLSAFYSMSDVALVTPLRDGMNLVCKEYIASKRDKTGVLILSEMAGAAKELSDAIIINPHDLNQMVEAIHEALTMTKDEQIRRNEELHYIIKRYNINNWVQVFMKRLNFTKEKQMDLSVKQLSLKNRKEIVTSYQNAEKRIIFLDYDGTLMPFDSHPENVKPDKTLLEILKKLTDDSKNKVVIISGRDKDTLENWLGHLPVDMIAEHGVWIKEGRKYWSLFDFITDEWKSEIRPILELYVDRTPGTFIEEKDYSLVWHYRKSDPALADLRGRELVNTLQYLTTNMHVSVMEGNKVIEVKNSGINKGKTALQWLQKDYDFILAAGDDWTDEDMFRVMPESAYTLKVGLKSSIARFNIPSCDSNCNEMRELLKSLMERVPQEIE